jgi:hypothetical protein
VCRSSRRQGGQLRTATQSCQIPAGLGCPRVGYQPSLGPCWQGLLNEKLGLDSLSSPQPHISRPWSAIVQLVRYGHLERKIVLFDSLANVPASGVIFLL